MCDTVVRLDSFVGSDKEKNPAFKEYHGMLTSCHHGRFLLEPEGNKITSIHGRCFMTFA